MLGYNQPEEWAAKAREFKKFKEAEESKSRAMITNKKYGFKARHAMIQTDEIEKLGPIQTSQQKKEQHLKEAKAYKWHTDSYLRGWRKKKHPMFRLQNEAPYRDKMLVDIDPHRIQVFSFEEIWRGVLKRLISLGLMKDPDEVELIKAAELEDVSSDEYEEEFNFCTKAEER